MGIAVSGGSDSMALLVLAAEAAAKAGVTLKAATVDHGLRPEAAEEARIVRDFCRRLDVDHVTLRWKRDSEDPVSQDRARRARHRLLAEWAERAGAGVVALGHTRDDRLETFLMRVRQGSGWHGLAGLLPTGFSPVWPEGRGLKVIRPLLAFGREELREDLRARGIVWIEDPSNEAAKFERVRMRKLLERMDVRTQARALKVMDGLMEMRRSVAAEAQRLLQQVKTADGVASLPLAARDAAGAEAWLRFVEAMVMSAGGAAGPPRREALARLVSRIATREPGLERGVTLAGAAIRLRKGALAFSQAPPRRDEAPRPGPDWDRAGQLLTMPELRMLAV
ncbi:MAG: tRNA lysidine(34) synthetase TilS [Hyphomonadaceae bacterium]